MSGIATWLYIFLAHFAALAAWLQTLADERLPSKGGKAW